MNQSGLKPSGPMGTILSVDGLTADDFLGSELDHWISLAGGATLTGLGVAGMIKKPGFWNIAMTLAGGALVYRGLTGLVYSDEMSDSYLDGMENPDAVTHHLEGIKVEHSIVINKPASEIYNFWRTFENLPKIMPHLESVTETNEIESHWKAKAPAGITVEWDAEVYMEKVNELISWRSVEGADVNNAGSVHFEEMNNGEATKLTVMLKYDPPLGPVGAAIAKLFGEDPEHQIKDDLKNFKKAMESGEFGSSSASGSSDAVLASTNGHSSNGHSSGSKS